MMKETESYVGCTVGYQGTMLFLVYYWIEFIAVGTFRDATLCSV